MLKAESETRYGVMEKDTNEGNEKGTTALTVVSQPVSSVASEA